MALAGLLRRKKEETKPPVVAVPDSDELPPFLAAKAVYRDRLKMHKTWNIVILCVAAALLALQEARFHGALAKYTNRELLIVPGAVDFMRVRPNILPDNAVFYFAEYVAEETGSFNYKNAEAKAERISEFATPAFRERYLADVRRNLKTWRELAVTEVFTPQPVTKFVLTHDDKGAPHYSVDVTGDLDRYSNDNKLLSSAEVFTIKFRTTRVQPDKPWFFELEDIKRMSLDDYNKERVARERMVRK
jgi:hypothetical protein